MEQTVTPVWVDPSWFSWEAWGARTSSVPNWADYREYEVHQHACDILTGDPNRDQRGDAIRALRRVVGGRVKGLKEIYQLSDLPTGTKSMKDLELLESLGIIRPFMLLRLIDLRNSVEHKDSIPPPTGECLMFADLVWYFLRSTDNLVHAYVEYIEFEPPQMYERDLPKTVVEFRSSFNDPRIWARLERSSFAYEARPDWLRIKATEIDEYETTFEVESTSTNEYEDVEISAVYVRGKVDGTTEQMRHLYQLYFKVSHFS